MSFICEQTSPHSAYCFPSRLTRCSLRSRGTFNEETCKLAARSLKARLSGRNLTGGVAQTCTWSLLYIPLRSLCTRSLTRASRNNDDVQAGRLASASGSTSERRRIACRAPYFIQRLFVQVGVAPCTSAQRGGCCAAGRALSTPRLLKWLSPAFLEARSLSFCLSK